jgi:hypothetical protein
MLLLLAQEFPVVLLEWVTVEESGTIEDATSPAESSSSARDPFKSVDAARTVSNVTADINDVTESGAIDTNSPIDDAADETMSEAEVEDLLLEKEIKEPEWRGTRRLVIKDTFHSYVRPVWQPKLTTFCSSLTGISQVRLVSLFPHELLH